ncbi:MAG: glycosyltransferase family 39 protein [Chloroflexi bacterium]|nr:glycosyltransferase family 39 protein [Chloroflexota bacterium]
MTLHQRLVLVIAVGLILLAAGVRFSELGAQSLWNDEGNSYGQSLRSPADIAINAAADIHPPGYYWLLAGWRVLTGDSEFALRSLSALASVLSTVMAYALGKRLYGDTAGLAALAVVAVNTFSITYAQEARMYALLALFAAASTWALIDVLTAPRWRGAVALALTTAGGLYTNYAFAGVLATHAVFGLLWLAWALWHGHRTGRVVSRVAVGYGVAILLYLPWLRIAMTQIANWGSTGDPVPLSEALPVAFGWLTVGPTYATVGVSVGVVLLMALGLYHVRSPASDSPPPIPRALKLALPPLWVVLTVAGFLALDLFRPANLKFLLPAQIAMALWMGRGAWVLWHFPATRDDPRIQRLTRGVAVLTVFAIVWGARGGIGALHTDPQFQRDDYRGIAQTIAADGQPNAAVILNAPGQIEVFGYYAARFGPGWELVPLPIGLTVDVQATQDAVRDLIARHDRIYAVLWGTDERDPQAVVETMLNTEAFPIDERWFGSVRLARYVTPQQTGQALDVDGVFAFPGGQIALASAAISATDVEPGDVLNLMLEFSADAVPPANYKITVQLLDASGVLVAQRDAEPVAYQRPTTTWTPGEIIVDRHALLIPNDLTPAQYRLMIGFYNPEYPGERLPVNPDGDLLLLADISVCDRGTDP